MAKQVDAIKVKYGEIKIYNFTLSPEEYLFEERQQRKAPELPVGFFNNPFSLREAKDLRYEQT